MGTRSRKQSNISLPDISMIRDGDVRLIPTGKSGGPHIVRRLNTPMVAPPQTSFRSEILAGLIMAEKVREYGEYLQKNEEDFYLQPRLFHHYLNVFFENALNTAPEKVLETPCTDGRQELSFPRISIGQSGDEEYLIGIKRIDNSNTYTFEFTFYKRTELREKLITTTHLMSNHAKNDKIENADDKLMFKGFLKVLETEEGDIPASYYRVLGPKKTSS